MTDSLNEILNNFQVAQQIRWVRVANRNVREIVVRMRSLDEQLTVLLNQQDLTEFSRTRAQNIQRQVAAMLGRFYRQQITPFLTDELTGTAQQSAEIEAELLKRAGRRIGIDLDVITPNPGVVATQASTMPFNGFPLNDWIRALNTADFNRTWSTIQDGLVSGRTNQEIVRDVIGSPSLRFKDGAREVTRNGAKTLVRTLTNHGASQGRNAVWEENGDIIRAVQWVATLDTRTSPICRERDGRVGPVFSGDDDFTLKSGEKALHPPLARPPAHPNCRSTTVAVTKSFRDLGFDADDFSPETRASMDGKVSSDLTYHDWLKKQSASVQQDALGPKRFKLWKEGGIAPEKFINDEGRQFTLDELKRKMPDAFTESGL